MSVNNGMKNVPDNYRNRLLNVITLAEDLFEYTMTITSNEKNFDPKFDRVFKNEFQEYAKEIYINLVDANEIFVGYDDNNKNIILFIWNGSKKRGT